MSIEELMDHNKEEDVMRQFFSFFSGALMGALVGVTLALLFAPSSGEEMRTQLQERARRLQEEIRQAAATRREELEKQLAALRTPQ
jgi:gas vesicle protein